MYSFRKHRQQNKSLKVTACQGYVVKVIWVFSNSPCPKTLRLAGQAESRLPTSGAGSSGPRCRTLYPGRAPWGLCGPDRNRLTCLAPSLCHLKVKHIFGKRNVHVNVPLLSKYTLRIHCICYLYSIHTHPGIPDY